MEQELYLASISTAPVSVSAAEPSCNQRYRPQLAKLQIKPTRRSDPTTVQQALLLAMLYCIEDWCQFIFWSTLVCIVGFYDEGTHLKNKVRAMKKNALEKRREERPELLQHEGLVRFGMKIIHKLQQPSSPLHTPGGRRVSRAPPPQIYAIQETPE